MKDQTKWQELLVEALNERGKIMAAYTAFHNYSMGNALLALSQCHQRKLVPGPLNTYKGWEELGRHVKKGERALTLCMPVSAKQKTINPDTKVEEEKVCTYFVYRPNLFVLSQTGGDTPVFSLPTPGFELESALSNLDIQRLEFDLINGGNIQGYARDRAIAINPVAQLPHKTVFHELAHVVLGHTTQTTSMVDSDSTPRCIREVEAESVALICCEALGLPGAEYCRGYIQHWLRGEKEIPSAQRIFSASTAILKAGSSATK
jgi:antirestriction protein ArdC